MRKRVATCLALAAALGAHGAAADVAPMSTASAVELYLPACAAGPFDGEKLLSLLRVELGAVGVSDVRERGPGHVTPPLPPDMLAAVELSAPACEKSTEVTIQVVDRATAKVVERTMAIADVAFDERPRALAIAIAELLQASWSELQLAGSPPAALQLPPEIRASIVQRLAAPPMPPAAVAAPVAPPVAVAPAPAAAGPRHGFVSAAALARAFPSRDTALLGGALSVSLPIGDLFAVQAGADAGYGDSHVETGTVGITALTGSAGIAAVAGATTTLEIGPVVHAGYVWANGVASTTQVRGSTYSSFVALGVLSTTLRVPGRGFTALAGFDVGAALASAWFLADNQRAAGFGGVCVGVRLGAALAL
ncbi:MAG TPA: hypothetical protein VHC69_34325 [Polyangiaceae bacterium]|nr:hypothetical protein [Polyangiaceae bacterium]